MNTPRTLAIIGTAGRDKDRPMTRGLWDAMCSDLRGRLRFDDRLVSGGAAWSDHLAVHAFLSGWVSHLTLHLPAPLERGQFRGQFKSAGKAANYYHGRFSQAIGVDTLAQVQQAIDRGCSMTAQPVDLGYGGMFRRNALVAKEVNGVVAYTWGDSDHPADGGTLNTWQQIRDTGGNKIHVPLSRLSSVQVLAEPQAADEKPVTPASSRPYVFRFARPR